MRLSADGKRWYKRWYEELKKVKPQTPRLILYYNRKQTHLLRMAMLMAAPRKLMRGEDLEYAKVLLDWMSSRCRMCIG